MPQNKKIKSLAKETMKSMAVRITLVVALSSGFAYWHLSNLLSEQHLTQLSKYTEERGARESIIFEDAIRNHETMKPRLQNAYISGYKGNVEKDFDRMFVKKPDGSWRDRNPKIDTKVEPTFFHGPQVPMTSELKERILVGRELIKNFGHAYEKQFPDMYFTTLENSCINFWPGLNWGAEAPATLDMRKEEYVYVADPTHNPDRKTRWTGMYYDSTAKLWMVSVITPIYVADKVMSLIGNDITLNELLDRTITKVLPGTKNIIIRKDGRLIAHPDYQAQIEQTGGSFTVAQPTPQTKSLNNLYIKLLANETEAKYKNIIEMPSANAYYGVFFIPGPEWYFIVEYPKTLIQNQAVSAAQFILLLGIISLLSEIVILYFVIRSRVAKPLEELVMVAERVSAGDFAFRSQISRQDEIGTLSNSMNHMLETINLRDTQIRRHAEELEQTVAERTAQVEASSKLASLGVMAGGIAHEINNPLSVIVGNASQIQRFKTKGKLTDEILDSSVHMIIKTSNRIAAIVKGLKSFARDGSKDPIQSTSIKACLDDSLAISWDKLKMLGIECTLEGIDENKMVDARSVQLTQVFVNLVSNSIDAIEHLETRWIKIICELDGKTTRIRFRDSGMGIPADVAKKIMTPFFSTKEVGKGTGLGLSISYGIIKDQGGNFYLNSDCPNTEFVVELVTSSSQNNADKVGVA